ncbi:hypothetical protein WJX84_010097 [Apatococcus fuscideae]|uniref:Large ribosomal subunit protein uL11c n=1 Tax=Apatococcus fuscideae TaxID=2026836 RepID=A0AAW1SYP1_9CHLO
MRAHGCRLASCHSPPPAAGSSLSGTPLHIRSLAARPSQRPQRQVTSMAAKVVGMIKLALNAGKANPAPPVGPALGSKGVNIMQFCKSYNAATQDKIGTVIPVEITVFDDRSFTFVLKTPPASVLLQKAAGVEKGSGTPNSVKVGKITMDQLKEIASTKLPDLNTTSVDAAMKIVAGTARNMGITISG